MQKRAILFSFVLLVLTVILPVNFLKEHPTPAPAEQQPNTLAQPPRPLSSEEAALREKFALLTEDEFARQAIAEIFSEYAGGIGRVLSLDTYEGFTTYYEQALPLREKTIAMISTFLQDQQIGPVLNDLIARYIERLAITDELPDGMIAVVNTGTGLVLLNARVIEERENREWLVLYSLIHEAVHMMHPDETGPEAHARIHDETLKMLEPIRRQYPDDYDEHRFIIDLALADIPEVSRPLRTNLENGANSEIPPYYARRLHELRDEMQQENPGQLFRYAEMSYDPETHEIDVSWK